MARLAEAFFVAAASCSYAFAFEQSVEWSAPASRLVNVGELAVSFFAVIGDGLKPKSFAGLFGAAPSVALATLALAVFKEGKGYAALEARSMVAGAVAFLIYCCVCMRVLDRGGSNDRDAFRARSLAVLCGWHLGPVPEVIPD